MRCAIASAPAQRTFTFPSLTALSASRRRQLFSRLPAARVRSISPPGRQLPSPPVSWRMSSARRTAFRSFSATIRVFFPRAAVSQAITAASGAFTPESTVAFPGAVLNNSLIPGIPGIEMIPGNIFPSVLPESS